MPCRNTIRASSGAASHRVAWPRLTIRAQAVRFENSKTILNADSATAMGEYYFTTLEGTVAKVEYTFQYKRGADGNLKIVVHHSSLPYSP